MPAEFESGFYVSSEGTPWHGMGVPVPNALTTGDAIVAAGLDWDVTKMPVHMLDGDTPILVPDAYITAKCANGKYTPLGIVGKKYRVLQNSDMGVILDTLVKEGGIKIHTAGSLQGGRKVWMLGRLHGRIKEVVPKDIVDYNILIANSHDGSIVVSLLLTAIRVVCMNTLMAAISQGREDGKLITIHHSGDPMKKVEEARRMLGLIEKAADEQDALMEMLAGLSFSPKLVAEGFEMLFPDPTDDKNTTRAENTREKLMEIYRNSPTIQMPGVAGTAWGFVNTVTQAVDHGLLRKYSKADTRLHSAWFGSGDALKNQAIRVCMDLADVPLSAVV